MDDDFDEVCAANRVAWDEAAAYHRAHPQYAALREGFARAGYNHLDEILTGCLQDLGLAGTPVVQLCCNNGREILSVKNLGAGTCAGFDQSKAFLEQARELAEIGGIDCAFHESNVYDIPASFDGCFGIVLITIGVFGWMPDLPRFLGVAAQLLAPGGSLVVYEDHPILNMFDDDDFLPAAPKSSYFRPRPWADQSGLDYFGGKTYAGKINYWFVHTMGAVITACLSAGLTVTRLTEYPHNVGTWEAFEDQPAQLPLSYLLVCRKQA